MYAQASGQLINLEKSTIIFGEKVFQHTREDIQ